MDEAASGIIIGVVGALIGAAGLVLSWLAGRKAERATSDQHRLAALTAAADWHRDLRTWASDTIAVLSEASYHSKSWDETGEAPLDAILRCRHRLSALIDSGRFYFPNIPAEGIGSTKPSAYRGWRHVALDPLVAAERVLSGRVGSGSYESREHALITMRREFVSGIQRVLAPDLHNQEIARIIREASERRSMDETLGGLLPTQADVPSGAERLLWTTRSHAE